MRQQVFQKAAKSLFCARMLKMIERSIQNEKASFNRANIVLCVIYSVTANQTSGQKNKPRSTSAQILYLVHHNELL